MKAETIIDGTKAIRIKRRTEKGCKIRRFPAKCGVLLKMNKAVRSKFGHINAGSRRIDADEMRTGF